MKSDPIEPGRWMKSTEKSGHKRLGFASPSGWVFVPLGAGILTLATATRVFAAWDFTSSSFFVIAAGLLMIVMIVNAIFVAGEAALDLLRISYAHESSDESPSASELSFPLDRKESVVAACVLGAQTCRAWLVLLSFLMAPSLLGLLGIDLAKNPLDSSLVQIFIAATAISIPVMFANVVIDLVAKNHATRQPIAVATRLATILRFFDIVFKIPAFLATRLASMATRKTGPSPSFATDTSRAEEEIKEILDSSEGTGEIEESERELLQSVFEFGDKTASKIMTPRVDIEAIPVDTKLIEIANLVESTGHSRFPVFEDTDDMIIGIIHAKDVLQAMSRSQTDQPLRELMRPAHSVNETKALHDLLAFMRNHQAQMVIVQDEYGGTSGLVTMEDIVEELVGDIIDEYDTADSEFVSQDDHHIVSGKYHLDELNDELGTDFDSEEFDTIGGFLFGLFGRQPKIGEIIEHDGFKFTVQNSDGRRIQSVKIEKLDPNDNLAGSF